MGSESRQRTKIITVRVYDDEYALITELAAAARCSQAEVVRSIVFDHEPQPAPVPCSPKHTNCTRHHRDVVDSYRDQRYREELALEAETNGLAGDIALWKANGGTMTTFVSWLKHTRAAS